MSPPPQPVVARAKPFPLPAEVGIALVPPVPAFPSPADVGVRLK